MNAPTIVIGVTTIPFAAAWVHLKSRPLRPVGYEIRVPRSLWEFVFDPGARKPESCGWTEFLWSDLRDLGTFIMDGWLKSMAEHSPSAACHWEWVIATVDAIGEDGDALRIAGRAERFDPSRFAEPPAEPDRGGR